MNMRLFSQAVLTWLLIGSAGRAVAQGQPAIHPDEGVPHVHWSDAHKLIGRQAFVYGEVVNVGASGNVHFLDVDTQRPGRFSIVIFGESLAHFPGSLEALYGGRKIRVRGLVTKYRDRPQVQVARADQITVLEAFPALAACEPPARAVRPASDEITIVTFNILNLFDEHDDPYRADESTPPKPRAQMERLAKTIRMLDADVVALQEVENRGYLERFVEVFLGDMGYEVVLFEGNDNRGIDVALLSQIPVGPVTLHRHLAFPDAKGRMMRFHRDVPAVQLRPEGGRPFEAWIVHLKSNSGGREYAEHIRLGEARKLRRLLDERLERDKDARIIVLGDFNDTWESDTMQTIAGAGPYGLRPFFEELATEARITYNQPPYLSMIDFILASPAMAERYVKGSYKIVAGSVETIGSDHNPVAARFRKD